MNRQIRGKHILFVDDNREIVDTVRQILERLGYQITPLTSSVAALEAFSANPEIFDLVITDMSMPNLTGDQLIRKLVEIRNDIPIILCTGFDEFSIKENPIHSNIKIILRKPVLSNELSNSIEKAFEN